MKVFGIAGHSGMGKTTLLERLIPVLQSRGPTVSLIKHSHKNVDIDRPGKDSYEPVHIENFNSLQVSNAERYVFSNGENFDLARRMLSTHPHLSKGPRMKA